MPSKKQASSKKKSARRLANPSGSGRSERRREEILAAAIKLFSARGYAATSTKDIGREIGLLAGSLYYHIRSKEDLLYEILRDLHTYALAEMATIDSIGGSPTERLRRLIRNHVTKHDVPRIRLFETEFHHLSPERHARIADMRRTYVHYVIKLIEEGQAEGTCDNAVNARATALAILGMVNSMPQWFNPGGPTSIEQMADTVDRIVVKSLGVST